jgi:acetylornithine deacetylase
MRPADSLIQPQRLKQLFQRLVDIYSPSGKEEAILEYIKNFLRRQGLNVIRQPVDSNRYNIIVQPENREPLVAFIGHLDTVEAYDLETFGYTEHDDKASGLGAADMKGGCAAMIEAFLAFHQARKSLPAAALCLVVGEEETGDGAAQLMKTCHFPWAVIGEPTHLVPCLGHFGYIEIQIAAEGIRTHASLADPARHTVETLLHTMLELTRFMAKKTELAYNIHDLFSSRSGFAVPERCEAWIDIHLPPAAPIGEIIGELEEICMNRQPDSPDIQMRFRTVTIDAGYQIPEKGILIDALKDVFIHQKIAWQPDTFRSHSDANQLWQAGVKPIILGPGRLEMAHTRDESVSIKQVVSAAEIYLDLMCRLDK